MSIEWKSRSPAPRDHVSQDIQILLSIASRLSSCAQSVPKNIEVNRTPEGREEGCFSRENPYILHFRFFCCF
jgi:hypothetical protein